MVAILHFLVVSGNQLGGSSVCQTDDGGDDLVFVLGIVHILTEVIQHLDLGIYYGNGKTKQASVQAEAYLKDKDEWRKEEYWNTRMVLVFSDGTRTSFDDFFDKDDFTKAIEAFEALEEEYETFINGGEE